ncbi:hypothetical protein, partial [Enterobacter kobei]|uniref:hypothetical protein n=1 Tax=Enterobacter kobei TaxID=208224 RepID=UPI001F14D57D
CSSGIRANHLRQSSRYEKAQGVNLGLEFFGFGTTERIPSVRDESIQFFREMQHLFPIYFQQ